MSRSPDAPDDRKELYGRGVAFLHGARALPDLTPAQVDRIARRLQQGRPRARRLVLTPVLVALAIVLLGGAALAVAGGGLARLPGVGRLFGARAQPAAAPAAPEHRRYAAAPSNAAPPVEAAPPARLVASAAAPPADPKKVVKGGEAGEAGASAGAGSGEPHAAATTVARPARRGSTTAPPTTTTPPIGDASRPAPTVGRESEATRPTTQPPPTTTTVVSASAPESLPPAPAIAGSGPETKAPVTEPPAAASRAPAAAESPIVTESRSFASALARWHRDHDAAAALAILDAHDRRFPRGELRLETQVLRAEIVLAGGREREALALLDPLALAGLPRARELRAVRGELRIKAGRCADGKADLGAVLAQGIADALAQRARQALAVCP